MVRFHACVLCGGTLKILRLEPLKHSGSYMYHPI